MPSKNRSRGWAAQGLFKRLENAPAGQRSAVPISTSASATAWWAHPGQQQRRPGRDGGRPADARTQVEFFIDLNPPAPCTVINIKISWFNSMATTGPQLGAQGTFRQTSRCA